MSTIPLLFNIIMKVPATVLRQENKTGIKAGKKTVFTDDVIMYTEYPKESTIRIKK